MLLFFWGSGSYKLSFETLNKKICQGLGPVKFKLKLIKCWPTVLILKLHVTTTFIVCNEPGAFAVFRLASLNQAHLKYHFYVQFLTCEFHVFPFNNDIIFQYLFTLSILFCGFECNDIVS